VSSPHQTIESTEIEGPFAPEDTTDETFGNSGFYLAPTGSREAQLVRFVFVATRTTRTSLPASEFAHLDFEDDPEADPALAPFLAANLNVPTDGFIAYQARSVASPADLPQARALAVYDHLLETLEYDWAGCTPDRIADLGNLKKACDLRTGTCTEWHGLYVGYLRALGVPAQFCFGFNIPTKAPEGPIPGYHCWAELMMPRAGWFPVDVTEAWKAPEDREFYFGSLDCNRIQFHVGRDLILRPRQSASVVDKWIFGHAELGGKAFQLEQLAFSYRDL
jgi:transglutaminase-like putative cysteine protease